MNLSALLQEKISKVILQEYSQNDIKFVVEHPEKSEFGDYSTNVAMVLSKTLRQAPMEIAKNLSYKFKDEQIEITGASMLGEIFDEITAAAPGFINFKLSQNWLIKLLSANLDASNNYGISKISGKLKVALEHSNVNPNKAVHVGHLRNACIGQFIERVYEKQGYDVDVQYYANNVGVQVATSMMGTKKITKVSPTSYQKFDHYAWDVYAQMEGQIADSEELQKERLELLTKLEDVDSKESIEQKELANKILLEQLKTFTKLGFDYDVIIYESDILAMKLWEKAFELLKSNPNVYFAKEGPSAGCWLVRLSDSDSQNTGEDAVEKDKIVVRSNGVATYTGKDIAYHMWKYGLLGIDFGYKKWLTDTQNKDLWTTTSAQDGDKNATSFSGVDLVFDVIGTEQTYAIDVVRQSLSFLGFEKQAENMRHINYGFVFLSRETAEMLGIDVSDGKKFYAMSGRRGWGIKVDDLIEKIDAKLTEQFGEFDAKEVVRNGAIKFQMLKINTFQDLIFDLNDALDIRGYSGPYLQYAYVRANSILKKAQAAGSMDVTLAPVFQSLDQKELDLLRLTYKFSEIIEKSARDFSPNLLCEFLFELAKKFSVFYNDLTILGAEDPEIKKFRLGLTTLTRNILKEGLWLLGIDAPDQM